jgi:SynChlorMet cassette protein ScmD
VNTCAKWVVNPDIVLREESDEWALLFNPADGQVVGVNPVGASIWKLLDGRNSIDIIIERIESEFSGVPDAVQTEVERFIDQLIERGFIGKVVS